MNLIKYYPTTTHLLQEDYHEFHESNGMSYNKYSSMMLTWEFMGTRKTHVNGQLHSTVTYDCSYDDEHDLLKEAWFYYGKMHRVDGPAYIQINRKFELHVFATHGYINKIIMRKFNSNVKDLCFNVAEKNMNKTHEEDLVNYEFKEGKVRCHIGPFCQFELVDEGYRKEIRISNSWLRTLERD